MAQDALRRDPGTEPQTVVIEPPSGWRGINFKELVEYRDLFRFPTYKAIRSRRAGCCARALHTP
ncbi:MAG: hypothetical protein R6V12_13170 [Candidatus Hydrogenedentota bacterium]